MCLIAISIIHRAVGATGRARWHGWAMGAFLVVVGYSHPARGSDQPPENGIVTTEQVLDVWRKRQSSLSSVSFDWTEKRFRPRESLVAAGREDLAASSAPQMSPEGLTLTTRCRLVLDGPRVRFEFESDAPVYGKNSIETVRWVSVFDGRRHRTLDSPVQIRANYQADITKGRGRELTSLHTLPVFLGCRPMDEDLTGVRLRRLEIVQQRQVIDGRSCVVVRERLGPTSNIVEQLYVDVPRQGAIVRFTRTRGDGLVHLELNIAYVSDRSGDWIPSGWTAISRNTLGVITEATSATVAKANTALQIANNTFELNFPPETLVIDRTAGDPSYSLILRSGESSPVAFSELTLFTIDELLRSKERQRNRWIWPLSIGVVIVCAAIMWKTLPRGRWRLS